MVEVLPGKSGLRILKVMAPSQSYPPNISSLEPVSRTYQYRKIMKPMLERKRRARINRCLDELKDLMTGALQAEGENVAKLEKADILELTVRHLHTLRKHNSLFFRPDPDYTTRYWDGFRHCAKEVAQFLAKCDQSAGVIVLKHINALMLNLDPYRQVYFTPIRSDTSHNSGERRLTRSPLKQGKHDECGSVWRPW